MKVMRFGKHKGKSFKWVAENDESYCKWVLSLEAPGAIKPFQDWLKVWESCIFCNGTGEMYMCEGLWGKCICRGELVPTHLEVG